MKNIETVMRDNQIIINGVVLPYQIAETLKIDDKIIVRVEPDIGHIYNSNILCFSKNGVLTWKIQESPYLTEEDNPFVSMKILPNGELFVSIWCGINYVVNLSNGFIEPYSFTK